MSFWWWFLIFILPIFIVLIAISVSKRNRRYTTQRVVRVQEPVIYTVQQPQQQIVVSQVPNNFQNSQHISPAVYQAEQRLNIHYAQPVAPPPYNQSYQQNQQPYSNRY
ncbi:unnamed protein product [Chironomus riparius]|uniref:Uncharacterized protein n=1 Tax=Chironomus riparius TaxID=315576 RepID=A0A9N9RMJ0_9DIPT|nr:unnamed protein product [Chironomus riparius]